MDLTALGWFLLGIAFAGLTSALGVHGVMIHKAGKAAKEIKTHTRDLDAIRETFIKEMDSTRETFIKKMDATLETFVKELDATRETRTKDLDAIRDSVKRKLDVVNRNADELADKLKKLSSEATKPVAAQCRVCDERNMH